MKWLEEEQKYYWTGLVEAVENFLRRYEICQKVNIRNPNKELHFDHTQTNFTQSNTLSD